MQCCQLGSFATGLSCEGEGGGRGWEGREGREGCERGGGGRQRTVGDHPNIWWSTPLVSVKHGLTMPSKTSFRLGFSVWS